jgi:hypothetical protein
MELFHQSVSTTVARLGLEHASTPFRDLFTLADRPMACIVAWGHPQVSNEDNELIKELSWHLAGAFFKREAEQHRPAIG